MTETNAPDWKDIIRERMAKLAANILSGETSVVAGARQMVYFIHQSGLPQFDPDLTIFIAVESESDSLPLGAARQYWAAEALERADREIEAVEALYRDQIMTGCQAIVQRFSEKAV